jgi:DNA repair ATPase RecN
VNELLEELIQSLQQACTSKNWEQVKQLDGQIKSSLQEIIASANNVQEKENMISDLKTVQKIYDLVIDRSRNNQSEIATELKKITKDRNAADSYLGVSQF